MKAFIAMAALAMASTAVAGPRSGRSQHPRMGLLAALQFGVDSDQLVWGANRKLGRVAAWAKANPRGIVVLEGHSDPRGTDEHNLELSLQRALSARRELVEAGVAPSRLVVVGFGERGPRDAARRRVAIWATNNDLDVVLARERALGAPVIRSGEDDAHRIAGRR